MGEVWRLIYSLPVYLASSEGRIMRVPYISVMPNGGIRQYGGEPHFGVWSKEAGRFLLIYKGVTYKVHRLVCEAFHGPAPSDTPNCLHIDENAANNRSSNLKWGTQKENLNAKGFLAYCSERRGEDHPKVRALKMMEKDNED